MILLDDAQSTAADPTSRLYKDLLHYWSIPPSGNNDQDRRATQLCFNEITSALARGEFVVAAFAYELGRQIRGLSPSVSNTADPHPLIEAWSFSSYQKLSKPEVDQCLTQLLSSLEKSERVAGVLGLKKSITESGFTSDIDTIQEYIRSGDTYQINHTYRIHGEVYGSPLALYERLRARQPGRFGAYIESRDRFLLSQSPELFIARKGDILKATPMKGTANALLEQAGALSDDPKNQAENVMIVDLLRNDLSRISLPNTVTVPHLFEVARHGDVLQMTSTVQGQVKPDASLFDIFSAVFPCGSVTGAPKKRSMQIIQELEAQDRGYYCGALGWLEPNDDFAFSVPIRTVEIIQDQISHQQNFTLGVGAGITNDSDAGQEWEECQIKSNFLTHLPSATGLFETIAIEGGMPKMINAHLDRLQSSALALGIPFDRQIAHNLVEDASRLLDNSVRHRLRLDLSSAGELSVTTGTLNPLNTPVKVFWADAILSTNTTIFSGDPLLRHKVSSRDLYDNAWQTASQLGGFDAPFTNEKGFVTEGGRSNLFIKPKHSNEWLTPLITAGLLPGVMRAAILADPLMNAREANLTIEDVSMADEIILSNALQGAIKAYF